MDKLSEINSSLPKHKISVREKPCQTAKSISVFVFEFEKEIEELAV